MLYAATQSLKPILDTEFKYRLRLLKTEIGKNKIRYSKSKMKSEIMNTDNQNQNQKLKKYFRFQSLVIH